MESSNSGVSESASKDIVLDLDLDFFVWPPYRDPCSHERLPDSECTHLSSEDDVRCFLEERCHLRREAQIPGRQFTEHEDAFRVWRDWLRDKKLSRPCRVIHVDAHADLGAGFNRTCHYIETELPAVPLKDRSEPRFDSKNGLCSANFLLGAIANQWIHRLSYVYPTNPLPPFASGPESWWNPRERLEAILRLDDHQPPVNDLPAWCFHDADWETKLIELKEYEARDFLKQNPVPVHVEPSVQFDLIPAKDFTFSGFTHMVVAQSPTYTPASADRLLNIIVDYFTPM